MHDRRVGTRMQRFAVPALVFLFPLVYYFRLIVPGSGMLILQNDFGYLYYVYRAYLIDMLAHGHVPWWSPAEAGGFAYFGNPFAGFIYPPNLLLLLVRLVVGNYNWWFHQIFTVLGVSWFALGVYRWLYEMFARRGAAAFAAILVSTCWSMGEFMRFTNAIHAIAWAPWVLLAMYRAHHTSRLRPVYFGVFALFCQITAGYPYFVVYSLFLYTGYAVYLNWRTEWAGWKSRVLRLAVVLGAPMLLTLPYTYAVSQLMKVTTDRAGGNFTYATEYQFGPADLIGSLVFPPVSTVEGCFYAGTLSVFILFLYFWLGKDPREKLAVALGAMFFLSLVFGFRSYIFTPIWSVTPVVNQMRVFSRMTIILLPILAVGWHQGYRAFSEQLQLARPERRLQPRMVLAVFGAILLVQVFLFFAHSGLDAEYVRLTVPSLPEGSKEVDFVLYTILTACIVLFVQRMEWQALRGGPTIALVILLGIATQDTGAQGRFIWTRSLSVELKARGADLKDGNLGQEAWAQAKNNADFYRLVRDYFTLDRTAGSGELTPSGLTRGLIPNWDYFSYTKFIRKWADRPALLNHVLGKQKLFFHEHAHEDLSEFVKDARANQNSAPAPRIVSFDGSTLDVEVRTAKPGYLTWTDNWDQGWSARLDGAPVPVELALTTFKSVHLEHAGTHRVRFTYRPVISGLAYAAAVLAALLLCSMPFWKKEPALSQS